MRALLTAGLLTAAAATALAGPPARKPPPDAGHPWGPAHFPDGGAMGQFHWDVPDIIEDVPVQGPLMSAGIPIKAHAVRTRWKGQELVLHIIRKFGEAGLWIAPPNRMIQLEGLPQLTAYNPLERISYTVMFQANPDGTTTLILSEAFLGQREPPGSFDLSHPPGAARLVTHQSEGMSTATYTTHLKPEQLVAHYAPQLEKRGLSASEELHFEGTAGSVDLMFAPQRDGGTSVVVISKLKGPR